MRCRWITDCGGGRWGAILVLAAVCLLPSRAHAKAQCFGPYTLNSVNNYAPTTDGDDVQDWSGDFTVNLAVSAGTLSVNVESKLNGGAFASLGTMNASSIAQFHGPLHRLRYNVTACSSCVATILACANKGD